jgi:N-acetylmuramoyl-L-alanine amidase
MQGLSENLKSTRFIIELERPADFQVFTLTNPDRVFVELPDVMLRLPAQPDGASVGLVKSFRAGVSAPGKARVVIDVAAPVIVNKAAIEKSKDGKPTRLVLEIMPARELRAAPAAGMVSGCFGSEVDQAHVQ